MTDLRDQLRTYGQQIRDDLEARAAEPDSTPATPPDELARGRARRHGRQSWLLIAAVTAFIALVTSGLFPSARLKESPLNKNASAWVLGLCLVAGCTATGAEDPPTTPTTPSAPSAGSATRAGDPTSSDVFDGTGMIEPGTYRVNRFGTPIELTMPRFWTRYESFALSGDGGSFVAFFDVSEVPADACRWSETKTPIGPTVDALVTALTSQRNSVTTTPEPRDLDGHRGVYLEIKQAPGLDVQSCQYQSAIGWFDRVGNEVPTVGSAGFNAVWALDLGDGQRVMVTWGAYEPLSTQQMASVVGIVDSIRIP